jgi:hypothetical protein
MNVKQLVSTLPLLFAISTHLSAQGTEVDRKVFEEIQVKAEKGDSTAQYDLVLQQV